MDIDKPSDFDYDVVVIGGGSGGISCARECAKLGAKVALFDYVVPSPQGTKQGLGGTCVNVGCIPKKLMHYSALLGASFHDAKQLGQNIENKPSHNWQTLTSSVNSYIRSLNFGYKVDMRKNKVKYICAAAQFVDPHTISYSLKDQSEHNLVTSKYFVIATGGRPKYPNIPGDREYGITSDDVFTLKEFPEKTLIIGASYISLETAGFLSEMGSDVTVAVRSILLRGFDQEIAERIGKHMSDIGVKFLRKCVPKRLEIDESTKQIKTTLVQTDENKQETEIQSSFDCVMFATGRSPSTSNLKLELAGVKTDSSGKIIASNEQSNIEHIFAIGDVLSNRQELTPVAIHAGLLLARRLFGGSKVQMDYNLVPTTIFSPLEYGSVGLAEEDAAKIYGGDNIEIFLSAFAPLEHAAVHRESKDGTELGNTAFSKLICLKTDRMRLVGFHYLGPNAGEITQGFALALKLGATKDDIDNTIGIHPTSAENFTTLNITKSSGENYEKSGC